MWTRRGWTALALLTLVHTSACTELSGVYRCGGSAPCIKEGTTGTCEPNSYCSFSDPLCASGRRYSPLSGEGLAERCVDEEPVDGGGGSGGDLTSAPACGAFGQACCPGAPELACGAGLACARGVVCTCIAEISAGANDTCVRRVDGTLLCWGHNNVGQLGGGMIGADQSDPVQVVANASATMPLDQALHVKSGGERDTVGDFACAIRETGAPGKSLLCWGQNQSGELGDGTNVAKAYPVLVGALALAIDPSPHALSVAANHTCARKIDGTIHCWGWGRLGQIGTGTVQDRNDTPAQVTTLGAVPGAQLAGGGSHSCALVAGEVHCWGRNVTLQLGQDFSSETCPGAAHCCVTGSGLDEYCAKTPERVPGLSGVVRLALGHAFTCVQRSDRTVACFGHNNQNQLGHNAGGTSATPGEVLTALGTPLGPVAQIEAGWYHACVIDDARNLYCWGANTTGQLGDGTTANAFAVRANLALPALAVTAGAAHTCALAADGQVYCWGSNDFLQIGQGDRGRELCGGTPCSRMPAVVDLSCP
jgi:alpha-tubulin suppressor-like RCC1 family protein